MLRPFPTRAFLAALLCYALWSRDLAREVLARIDRALPSDIVDPLLNTLVLDWNSRHLPLTDAWWQFPMFAPLAGVTTFTEHLLGISLFASPLVWMTGSPVTAYNLMFVAAPVFASAAMFALAWHLTRDAWASAIAGFTFGFPLYGAGQVSHLQMFITGWMPLVLLGLHRYFEEGRARWLALVGVGWLLTAASNGYFLVFFGVLVGLWLAWFGLRARSAGRLVVAGAVLVVASLPLVPLLAHYAQVHRSYGFARWAHEIEVYSADVSALLRGSPRLSLWGGRFPPVPTEVSLFPGVTFAALAAGGAWRVLARTEAAARWRWRHVLLAFAALALVAGLVILWTGGWRGSVLGLRVSMGRAEKAFGVAAAFAVAWMATGARSRAAWRRADAGVFYAWAAFATWLFALGPRPHLAAAPLLHAGPYQLLLMLPGGDALRVPSRFWTMTLVCLAVLAAFGVQAARGRLGGAARWAVPLALVALLASESHYRVRAAVLPSRALDNDVTATDALVLEFPMGDYRDLLSVYRAIHGGYRTVNGYSGYYPPHYTPLGYGLDAFRDGLIDVLRERGPVLAVIRPDAKSAGELLGYLSRQPGALVPATSGVSTMVLLPKLPPPAPARVAPGPRLPLGDITASTGSDRTRWLVDGDVTTDWSASQRTDADLVVDLGRARPLAQVVLAMGPFAPNFPRRLEVAVSRDRERWDVVWDAPVEPAIVRSALADPVRVPLTLPLGGRDARYLRIRQTGRHQEYPWSIAELEVYGTSDARARP